MGFEQIDIPESNIKALYGQKEYHIVGVQVLSASDSSGVITQIRFIDKRSANSVYRISLIGPVHEMSDMVGRISKQMPAIDVADTGKYCIVSNLKEKLVITLTEEGKRVIENEGTLAHMFDEMDNGTVLELHTSTDLKHYTAPMVKLTFRASRINRKKIDSRAWWFPDCDKFGKKQFWRHLQSNGYIILELINKKL